jgi:pantetheine-phosphate adenylyltransferase
MSKIAFYPGTFDPPTTGHLDMIGRAAGLFEHIVVGVAKNPTKAPLIPFEERRQLLLACVTPHWPNVSVVGFDGLTVQTAQSHGAMVLLRGLRAMSDFEHEFMMAQMNKTLCREMETMFLMAALEHQFVSSSLVKEVVKLGGDISAYVPSPVVAYFKQRHL